MQSTRFPWLEGWKLTGVLSALLAATAGVIMTSHGSDIDGVRLVIRTTARTSVVLFLVAFTASSLAYLVPSRWTQWQRRNRRYLGVSFAVSHGIHAWAIVELLRADQALFWQLSNVGVIVTGGLAYLFIIAMTATSFDRTAAWIGPKAWAVLHTSGAYYIWLSFVFTFGKRAIFNPAYWPVMVLIALAFLIRLLAARLRRSRRSGAASGAI